MNEHGFHTVSQTIKSILDGNIRALARSISHIENQAPGIEELLKTLEPHPSLIIGITGPPGAGKSSLADALTEQLITGERKVAILCVDPSSSFHSGALLGDRIRMNNWYNHPRVYIRSFATRGSVGGLHPYIFEITDLLKAARYDFIIIETVGVGQTEIEIAAIADKVVVVLVPEAGDDIQAMKAGLMEVGDIFVVNKSDRPGADIFQRSLKNSISYQSQWEHRDPVILQTIATKKEGIRELADEILKPPAGDFSARKISLLAEKGYSLIAKKKMKNIHKADLIKEIKEELKKPDFNLYRFVEKF